MIDQIQTTSGYFFDELTQENINVYHQFVYGIHFVMLRDQHQFRGYFLESISEFFYSGDEDLMFNYKNVRDAFFDGQLITFINEKHLCNHVFIPSDIVSYKNDL